MRKVFNTTGGSSIIIEITKEGKVIYSVGRKKTTFDIGECDSITYEYTGGQEKFVITEDKLAGDGACGLKPWLWIVICEGEKRLEYNNNRAETRRHCSYSGENDKISTLKSDENVLDKLLAAEEREAVRKAVGCLEPRQRELIFDVYYRGLSMADIARRDGVSRSSVSRRMARVIARLKKYLKNFI